VYMMAMRGDYFRGVFFIFLHFSSFHTWYLARTSAVLVGLLLAGGPPSGPTGNLCPNFHFFWRFGLFFFFFFFFFFFCPPSPPSLLSPFHYLH
jgi:hypothetical protein